MTVYTVSTSVQLCTSEQQHGLRGQWCGLYGIHGQRYGLLLCIQRLCSCKNASVNESFVHSGRLYRFSLLPNTTKSGHINPLPQTVHSNNLILLQFISCVVVHTTFMSLQVAGVTETFVTLSTLVQHLRCFLITLHLANALQHTWHFMVSLPCGRSYDTVEFQSM